MSGQAAGEEEEGRYSCTFGLVAGPWSSLSRRDSSWTHSEPERTQYARRVYTLQSPNSTDGVSFTWQHPSCALWRRKMRVPVIPAWSFMPTSHRDTTSDEMKRLNFCCSCKTKERKNPLFPHEVFLWICLLHILEVQRTGYGWPICQESTRQAHPLWLRKSKRTRIFNFSLEKTETEQNRTRQSRAEQNMSSSQGWSGCGDTNKCASKRTTRGVAWRRATPSPGSA